MKLIHDIKLKLLCIGCLIFISCEDFVEPDAPNHIVSSEQVFNTEETARSAMMGIYNQLTRTSFCGGWENSVSVLAGLSSDNLTSLWETNFDYMEFDQHSIIPDNSRNQQLWAGAYNLIYMCNSVLEGIQYAPNLSEELRNSMEGEAKFMRAFSYFYLTNLYNDIPLLLTTDYENNALANQTESAVVYQQILSDLISAEGLTEIDYRDGERRFINKHVVRAFLARVHLYLENYEEAEYWSTQVIAQEDQYQLMDNLNETFLANSPEAIWQISPIGQGGSLSYTYDGYIMIIDPNSASLNPVRLTQDLLGVFDNNDLRRQLWINYDQETDSYYAYKYKDRNSTNNITEYSMVLRLAEQYLIRAEARAKLGNLNGGISDLNIIRDRAGLPSINEEIPNLNMELLLNEILLERRRELYTEWGHRWLDLKRTGNAAEVFENGNTPWQDTDTFYPIPEEERMKNPNLGQNPGY